MTVNLYFECIVVISSFDSPLNESREKDHRITLKQENNEKSYRFSQNKYNQTNTLTYLRTFYTQTHCKFSCFFSYSLVLHFWFPRYFCSFSLLYIFLYTTVTLNFPQCCMDSRRIWTHRHKRSTTRQDYFCIFEDNFVFF